MKSSNVKGDLNDTSAETNTGCKSGKVHLYKLNVMISDECVQSLYAGLQIL